MTNRMLITGGSRGIGAATARLAAAEGFDVAITYVGAEAAARGVVADVEAKGRRAVAIQGDIAQPRDVARMFEMADRELGGIDAFFNNAGIFAPALPFVDISLQRLERMLDVNVLGSFLAAQEAVRRMMKSRGGKGGAIVNMSSIASKLGGATGFTDYGASKGAIDAMTIGMAKELAGEGIRVNAVRPGLIDTEIHANAGDPGRIARLAASIPLQRGGKAEEVAEAVLWLCSDKAAYVTGQLLDVAGGRGL
ncbi:MAG: glucose 1-dehydrogenase [Hyphomicrobiaceae bacterium]|nr:glucose 1-dehydrogenase [Hyphomicrobiaceae bacterium]